MYGHLVEMSRIPVSPFGSSPNVCEPFLQTSAKMSAAEVFPVVSALPRSHCLFDSFTDVRSYAEVVTGKVKPMIFWESSIKFQNMVVASSCKTSKTFSRSPFLLSSSSEVRSSSLYRFSDFLGGMSSAEVVASKIESMIFWQSSMKLREMVVALSCKPSKDFTSHQQRQVQRGKPCSYNSVVGVACNLHPSVPVSNSISPVIISKSLTSSLPLTSQLVSEVASPVISISPTVTSQPVSPTIFSETLSPVLAEHGIQNACSRNLRAVIPHVERGQLSVSEKVAVKEFVSKLKIKGSPVGGFKGTRYEWLFANRSYSYGKKGKRVIQPCGTFSEVEHLCAGVVRDLQLAKPNACLLVYYPRGTSGLNCHKDNEPVHASDQVITLCHGAGATPLIF